MKFKVGDKVKIKDTENVRHYSGSLAIGEVRILTEQDIRNIKLCPDSFTLFNNIYGVNFELNDLQLLYESEVSMKDIKYGVKYDRDTDPVEFFKSKPQAKKRIQELLDDPEVKKESIYLFQVGKVEKVQRLQNFELVKV